MGRAGHIGNQLGDPGSMVLTVTDLRNAYRDIPHDLGQIPAIVLWVQDDSGGAAGNFVYDKADSTTTTIRGWCSNDNGCNFLLFPMTGRW